MHGMFEIIRFQQRRFALIFFGFLLVALGLWMLGQPAAAALIPLIAVLLVEILWRDLRARSLARWIVAGSAAEKIEVPPGAWGDLSRAVNGLLQQRRLQQRLQAAAPAPLPDDAVQALLGGELSGTTELRVVSVLALSCGGTRRIERDQRAALAAWQVLARVAQAQAHAHGALLQPCGDALLLVFGAFTTRPAEASAHSAIAAAAALRQAWQSSAALAGGALALGLASGPALVTMVPGLGCCVLGTPVEQAMQIERLATSAPWWPLLCGESAYYALRRAHQRGWTATEFSVHSAPEKPQAVYGWCETA